MTINTKKFTGKAIVLDYVDLLTYDDTEIIGVCLTQRQVAILKAMLIPAYWTTRWSNLALTPSELELLIAEIDNQLSGENCGTANMIFRDNPLDTCEVQYSTNGGINWSTMFRKDNCAAPASETTITNIYEDITLIENNNTTWAGDIINVAPKWEYLDPDQDNALCLAIQKYVSTICKQSVRQINRENQEERDANDWMFDALQITVAAVVTAIATTILGIATAPATLVGAFVWASMTVAEAAYDQHVNKTSDMYEDEDAIETIACFMWEQVAGSTPQHPAWRDSLLTWESFGDNERVIAEQVNIWNQDEDIYISWMILWEELNEIADVLPACPCPETWSHKWAFATHGPDTWEVDKLGEADQVGAWMPDAGFLCLEVTEGGYDKNLMRWLNFPDPVPNVTTMTVTYDCLRGDFDGIPESRIISLTGLGARVDNSGVIADGDAQQHSYIRALGNATSAYVMLRVSTDETPIGDWGYGLITHIEFEGEGVDPFAGRETS